MQADETAFLLLPLESEAVSLFGEESGSSLGRKGRGAIGETLGICTDQMLSQEGRTVGNHFQVTRTNKSREGMVT